MAKRKIIRPCGHFEWVDLDAPFLIVERRISLIEHSRCETCQGNGEMARNRSRGFVPLFGTPDQRSRAEAIRSRVLVRVERMREHVSSPDEDMLFYLKQRVLGIDDASWWVEHRYDAVEALARDMGE
jgi:hypothetical protein